MTDNTINDDKTIAGGGEGATTAGRYRIIRQLGQGGDRIEAEKFQRGKLKHAMINQSYCCTYKTYKGDIVTEMISASSEKTAIRRILFKHPLAEIIDVRQEPNDSSSRNG